MGNRVQAILDPLLSIGWIWPVTVLVISGLASVTGSVLARRPMVRKLDLKNAENSRLENQLREQSRHLARMQREHGSLASLMRALPQAVAEINSSELET